MTGKLSGRMLDPAGGKAGRRSDQSGAGSQASGAGLDRYFNAPLARANRAVTLSVASAAWFKYSAASA